MKVLYFYIEHSGAGAISSSLKSICIVAHLRLITFSGASIMYISGNTTTVREVNRQISSAGLKQTLQEAKGGILVK